MALVWTFQYSPSRACGLQNAIFSFINAFKRFDAVGEQCLEISLTPVLKTNMVNLSGTFLGNTSPRICSENLSRTHTLNIGPMKLLLEPPAKEEEMKLLSMQLLLRLLNMNTPRMMERKMTIMSGTRSDDIRARGNKANLWILLEPAGLLRAPFQLKVEIAR